MGVRGERNQLSLHLCFARKHPLYPRKPLFARTPGLFPLGNQKAPPAMGHRPSLLPLSLALNSDINCGLGWTMRFVLGTGLISRALVPQAISFCLLPGVQVQVGGANKTCA